MPMTLKDTRQQAIALARTLDNGGVVAVWRIRPRVFAFAVGYGPQGCDLVMLVHNKWAREGWYDKYHPEWVGKEQDR